MRLIQIAQRAVDLERATAFYTGLLGTAPTAAFDPPGLVFFDLDGVRLLLEKGAPSAVLYLAVEDIHAVIDGQRSAGTTILGEPHVIFTHRDDALGPAGTEEWQAFLTDSEGNTVGLVEHRRISDEGRLSS
ncbi:VOC family protein [Microbacterium hydrocarbonoxydans]|uniref:VOC family protein n=1 Tax=Microbacterium hydrocarbonoxydans TaxID=273678 RepID=UPI0007BB56DD|nr:VOC family protein [Microbacterium hydrocarbonoxydans]GAT73548.1 methylmalonyl-CoA epimerase [Microbacterium sp. HM58-2]